MYEEFFGLKAKPFQLSPDAAFFYPSREHQRALSFLQYGLDQGDGFIVIGRAISAGHTVTAESDPRDFNAAMAEPPVFHALASNSPSHDATACSQLRS